MNNFLQYDLVALDAQYFIRGHVPEWDDKMAEFAELSAQRHNLQNTILDISYGDQPRQKLDVLIPQNVRQNAPVFVFFHGGYWRMMDKSQFGFVACSADAAGAVTVVVNYRLLPETALDAIVDDACEATRWVLSNISDFGGDPSKIVMCGHSAGAQLAAQVATRVGRQFRAFIGISGVYDLNPISQCFLNDIEFLNRQIIQRFDASETVSALPCRGQFAYGGQEPEEFIRQSEEQASFWHRPGSASSLTAVTDANHATIVEQLKDPTSQLGQIIAEALTS